LNDAIQLDVWSQIETAEPRRKLVMLGASNLSRAFPTAVSLALNAFEVPIAIYLAKGHGRSYGKQSICFGRKISGIFQCGIWQALSQENCVPISAWLTDIGNDLAYEEPVTRVLEWVETCVDRLQTLGAQIVLSDLPIEVLRAVSATRYRLMRSVLFPNCRLAWPEMLSRAEQLSQCLNELAKSRKIAIFTGNISWYGWDPIHPRPRHFVDLWSGLLQPFVEQRTPKSQVNDSLLWRTYLHGLRPEQWSQFSIPRRASQPQGRLCDGSTIFLY